MKGRKIGVLVLFLVSILALVGIAQALPVNITEVQVDGTEVEPNGVNRLDLIRDGDFEVRVEIVAEDNLSDVEIAAFIFGYEYNDHERIADFEHISDMESGVKYVKKLKLHLPDKVDEDDYKLRVVVADRYGDEEVENFNLKLDVERHQLKIRDVVFTPAHSVQAGRLLVANVRVKNLGEKDEEAIKVTVRIPELGVEQSTYIDELEYDESTLSEPIYLRIPDCSPGGRYSVEVEVEYDEGYESYEVEDDILVTEDESCDIPIIDVEAKPSVTVGAQSADVNAGTAAVFPITISNPASQSKNFVVSVEGVEGWASVQVQPSNTISVAGQGTQTIYVYLTPSEEAAEGAKMFSVKLNDGEQEYAVTMTANVKAGSGDKGLIKGLEVTLYVLIALLVIIGLIVLFTKLKGGEEEEDISGQAYY